MRASYRDAIDWIAFNDDTEDMQERGPEVTFPPTVALVADVFGKTREEVGRAVLRVLERERREELRAERERRVKPPLSK